ncbi:MAG: radical SAM protein [Pseudomonadales bacterium]|jgi:sulfatase maturation enzyme AslB (radical SAM superfamily)|nr:radical SAM protein [Pseudomonadales bacterium]
MSHATLRLTAFDTLWIHTGTACNLSCTFCHEGSSPADTRIPAMTLALLTPQLHEAAALGVGNFAFTGGEPLILREILPILKAALTLRPTLVLTNGMAPFIRKSHLLAQLLALPHALRFRVSIDWPDEARHDAGRGHRSFRTALEGLRLLHAAGFAVGITRQRERDEEAAAVDTRFRALLRKQQLPEDMPIVSLPELGALAPNADSDANAITDATVHGNAYTSTALEYRTTLPDDNSLTYHAHADLPAPACTHSRLLLRRPEGLRIAPCPLVDDRADLDLADNLPAALRASAQLTHPRCHLCLTQGVNYIGD